MRDNWCHGINHPPSSSLYYDNWKLQFGKIFENKNLNFNVCFNLNKVSFEILEYRHWEGLNNILKLYLWKYKIQNIGVSNSIYLHSKLCVCNKVCPWATIFSDNMCVIKWARNRLIKDDTLVTNLWKQYSTWIRTFII
jgi:hypothetical protein